MEITITVGQMYLNKFTYRQKYYCVHQMLFRICVLQNIQLGYELDRLK